MISVFARVVGLVATAAVVLAIASPSTMNIAIASGSVMAAIGVLVATYSRGEDLGVRTDGGGAAVERATQLPLATRAAHARAAILKHLATRPVEAVPLLASFMRTGYLDSAEMTPEAAPASLERRVRALTDKRALELAERLGL